MAGRARRAVRKGLVASVLVVVSSAVLATTGLLNPMASRALAPSAVGEFHPVPVTRVFDSRGFSPAKSVTTSGSSFDVNLAGAGAVLPDDPSLMLGIIANVTVTGRPGRQARRAPTLRRSTSWTIPPWPIWRCCGLIQRDSSR